MRREFRYKRFLTAAVTLTVVIPLMFLSSCSYVRKTVDERSCINFVDSMLEDYLASPQKYKWSKVCETGYNPASLDKNQAELLSFAASKVKYFEKSVTTDGTGEMAKVSYTFTNVPDVSKLNIYESDLAKIKNEIRELDRIDLEVTFQIVKSGDDWRFHSLSKFGRYFIHPFCDLVIGEEKTADPDPVPSGSVPSGASDLKDNYLASVWYGIETGNPLDDLTVSDAYAVQNVFYFKEPVSGTFLATLMNDSNEEIMRMEIKVEGQITVVCDFSAGLEGMGTFAPGKYRVDLYAQGEHIGSSDYLKVTR